jgi:hypothetical protein
MSISAQTYPGNPTQLRVTIPICHIGCHYHTCTSLYRPSLGFTAEPCTYSSGQLVRWALHLPSNHTPQLRKRGAHTHLNQTLTGGPEEHREVSPLDDRPPAKSLLDYGIIGTGRGVRQLLPIEIVRHFLLLCTYCTTTSFYN